jgi:hypothetical protein
VIAAAVVSTLARSALVAQRQFRTRTYEAQAMWLAESAIERAVTRLSEDANYRQETWTIGPEELGGTLGGTASIRVMSVSESPAELRIAVIAEYPNTPERRVRYRRELAVRVEVHPTTT